MQYLWRQRDNTKSVFKYITKTTRYQSITKDFLQDHFNKLIIVEKIIYKITGIKALKRTLMQI